MNDEERMDEISGVHARAMLKVSQSLKEEETSSFKTFLVNLKPDYTKRIEPIEEFQAIARVLLSGGIIKHGKYKFLKDFFYHFGRLDLVDVLIDAERDMTKQKENDNKILLHHADLAVELKRTITPSQLETLILFFRQLYSDEEMDEINSFNDMWKVLTRRGEVSPGRYDILEKALRSIQATSHLQILNEFNEKIKSEDGRYEGWMRQGIVVNSVGELMGKMELCRGLLEDGTPGVMFKNATISNIGAEGGELPLTNGSAKLDVPPEAVDGKLLFWMFVGQDCGLQFAAKSANEPLTDSDGIVKYSIPVRLGPSDIPFNNPVWLNTKQFSEPPSANGLPRFSVYSRVDCNTEWKHVGSCLYDADSNNNLRARISLNHFSSYVLGMPVSSDLLPLNVRVMVQSHSVKAEAGNAGNELQVFFLVNDCSFSQELVLQNLINVDSVTCLYLDPKHDVSVSWVRRHSVQKSVRCIKKEILHKEHIQNLAETPVSIKVAAIDCAGSADMIETESEFEDILVLEQNGTVLVELPFTESASAVTTSAEHPTDCPEETSQVTDLSKRPTRATLSGNKDEVQRLLNEGANIETRDQSPLHAASQKGHENVVELLLDRGADIESKTNWGKSPLYAASEKGHENVVELLLDRGADIERKNKSGQPPLYAASTNGHDNVVKLLLDRGVDIDSKTSWDDSPLYAASQNAHENVVKLLLDRGADIDSKTSWGASPLYAASQNGHDNVVKLLLDRGADIDSKTSWDDSPLYAASQNGHENVVKLLLDRGAYIDSTTSWGGFPLYVASQNGHENVVKLLLDRGAYIDSKARKGQSPLYAASKNGHENVVKLLLDREAYIDSTTSWGESPLSAASQNGHDNVVKLLLDRGAYIDSKASYDQSPLYAASQKGHENVVKLLLDRGADIDSKANRETSPLYAASENGHENVVKLLLDRGANVESKTISDESPLYAASQNGHENVVKLLLDRGADIDSKTIFDQSLLYAASQNGHENVVKLLLDRGANSELVLSVGHGTNLTGLSGDAVADSWSRRLSTDSRLSDASSVGSNTSHRSLG